MGHLFETVTITPTGRVIFIISYKNGPRRFSYAAGKDRFSGLKTGGRDRSCSLVLFVVNESLLPDTIFPRAIYLVTREGIVGTVKSGIDLINAVLSKKIVRPPLDMAVLVVVVVVSCPEHFDFTNAHFDFPIPFLFKKK